MITTLLLWRAMLRAWRPLALLPLLAGALLALWLLCQLFGSLPAATHAFAAPGYWAFLAPALATAAVAPGALLAGRRLLDDRQTGALERLLASALWPGALVLAETFAAASQALVLAPVVLLASTGAGLRPDDPLLDLAGVAFLSVVLGLCYAAWSALLALVTCDARALRAGSLVVLVAGVVGSDLLLPASLLPGWVTWLAGGNPLSIAADEARRLFAPAPSLHAYLHAILVLAVVALAGNAGAIAVFSCRREGALANPR